MAVYEVGHEQVVPLCGCCESVTLCFTRWVGRQGLVTEENSASRVLYSVLSCCREKNGLRNTMCEMYLW